MIVTAIDLSHGLEGILNSLMTQGAALGWTLIKAFLVFIVGRLLINLVNKLIKRVLSVSYTHLTLPTNSLV